MLAVSLNSHGDYWTPSSHGKGKHRNICGKSPANGYLKSCSGVSLLINPVFSERENEQVSHLHHCDCGVRRHCRLGRSDASKPNAVYGLITKPSAYSVDLTRDRLETALKDHGFMIFARLDHAAAAASVGLKMPRETVLVFGNPRIGTPNLIKYPTLAIDPPIKALVWEDADGKVWLSYNMQKYLNESAYARHGAPIDTELTKQMEGVFAAITDAATK